MKKTAQQALYSITTDTPAGAFHIIIDKHDTARASGFGDLSKLIQWLPDELSNRTVTPTNDHVYTRLVQSYFMDNKTVLNTIPHDQPGTAFQKKCWQAISDVPYGETMSYKQLAQAAGKPTAIRAAGTICGRNRLALLIPCHRILKSDGTVGSYLYGSETKRQLLAHEQTTFMV